jgi:hypothetical protein
MHMRVSDMNSEASLTLCGPIGGVSGRLVSAGARRLVLRLREGGRRARARPQARLGVRLGRRQLAQPRRQLVRVGAHRRQLHP